MQRIFRKEVLKDKQPKWIGKALLIGGIPSGFIGLMTIFFLLGLLSFLIFGSYTRRITVYGEVITSPRATNIFAVQKGVVSTCFVNIGDNVDKGQPLFLIDISHATEEGKVNIMMRKALEKQLEQINKIIKKLEINKKETIVSLQTQKQQYELAYSKSSDILNSIAKGVDNAKSTMLDYQEYQKKGLVTKDQLNSQINVYYQQQTSYQNLYNQHIQDSLQITKLESDIVITSIDFDNQISQYMFQSSDIERQLAEVDAGGTFVINSPVNGRIESLNVYEGQMIDEGNNLVQIIPNTDPIYYLILWLPNSNLPYIAIGDIINIRYDAFPHEKFGQFSGMIESISYVPSPLQEMASYSSSPVSNKTEVDESYYKVLVLLKQTHFSDQNKEMILTNGMRAQATLFLESRQLYQWMFTPFYDVKKSLIGPINE